MKLRFLLCWFAFSLSFAQAQDSLYTRKIIRTLTSPAYNGRGYVKGGEAKAAGFISHAFRSNGLTPIGESFYQSFPFPVNTFPGKMEVTIDSTLLQPGIDYIVHPASGSLRGEYSIQRISRITAETINEIPSGTVLLLDSGGTKESEVIRLLLESDKRPAALILLREKKLTWSVSTEQFPFAVIEVLRASLPKTSRELNVRIDARLNENHVSKNVIGFLPGTSASDSFLVVTAHYDHLGRMGKKTYFPGANDNASGVSMMLNLSKYYAQPEHRLRYPMLFIAFAGEEAGLLGSEWFTTHPVIDLKSIRFLINLDLDGTGDDGIMVVNGDVYPKEFAVLDSISSAGNLLPKVGKRGKAHNSDHYYFTEKGVPAFFIYTLGGISAYHDIYDREVTLPLTRYKEVFKLLIAFLSCK